AIAKLERLWERLAGGFVLREFEREQQAFTAHVHDALASLGEHAQSTLETFAHAAGIVDHVAFEQLADGGYADGARDGISSVGVAGAELHVVVDLAPEGPRHPLLDQDARQWCVAAADSLAEAQQVGGDAIQVGREQVAGASEARDDFVEDEQDVVAIADCPHALEIAWR